MNELSYGRVSRPSRYIGNEINAVRKKPDSVDVKYALAFPDTYEIGMSHLGLKILYEILNRREDTLAERVYAPWKDMEEILRRERRPLCSLESNLPLSSFDIIGFTLQYEMSYTNILNMLDLSGIPLLAAERSLSDPLIIGGGPCAFNPEPLADFFDLFVIGDGEEIIEEITDLFKEYRFRKREDLLQHLARIEGVYVPSHFEIGYHPDGRIREIHRIGTGPSRIRKRLVPNLDGAPYPCAPVLPYMKTIHDRVALEISRGCTRGCRFCQAGMIYRPVRERNVQTLLTSFRESFEHTGHEEVSLNSLSSGDYTALEPLMEEVVRFAGQRHISVSLPSLRPGTLTSNMIGEIRKIRKTGFTIAPEAGTQRLRDVINKGIREEDVLDTVSKVFQSGWEILKLYFMIGLPTETREDLEGIADLTLKALRIARRCNPRFKKINVSVSPFVPKAHTPFQWCAQESPEKIRGKYQFLKKKFRHNRIVLKWHDPEISMLEGVFARGDRRLGRTLVKAWRGGCRFDGWTEEFDLQRWLDAFQNTGMDPGAYLDRPRDPDEVLPWSHLDSGIRIEFLKEEYSRALRGEQTPDCRTNPCSLCGVCDKTTSNVYCPVPERSGSRGFQSPEGASRITKRFRIRYSREGRLRFLSHLEMITLFTRALSRAGIPIVHSQGFHPHPRIAMGPPLPVGVEGNAEYLDLHVKGALFPESLQPRLQRVLPDGIRITGVNWIPNQAPSVSSVIRFAEYLFRIPKSFFKAEPTRHILNLMRQEEIRMDRSQKGRTKIVNIRPMIHEIRIDSETGDPVGIRALVQSGDRGGVRPNEIVQCLLDAEEMDCTEIRITRIGLYTDTDRNVPFQEPVEATVP